MIDDVLGSEGCENVVLIFLDDSRCEPVAELFSYPLFAQRLEGLCLGCGQGGEVVILLDAGEGADADALAVDALCILKTRRLHLDKMSHQVLCAGSGS